MLAVFPDPFKPSPIISPALLEPELGLGIQYVCLGSN